MAAASRYRPLTIFVTLVLLAGTGYYFYSRENQSKTAAPEYTTTTVVKGDVVQHVTATGQLEPLISVDVGSQISGLVQKLYVDFNSTIKKGDKLAEIDSATYRQKLRQAQADLAATEANNRLQHLNTDRTKSLFEQKLVTQQDLDQAIALLQQSDAQLLTRKAVVENAQVDLDRCTISSPIDGIVLTKSTEEGKTVAASLNSPILFVIANDLAKMKITAAVAEADIGNVRTGQPVSFTVDAFIGREFKGQVTQVRNSPKTAQNVVTYETIIDVDNADLRLRPGMTTNVSIAVARRENTLKVVNAALRIRVPESLLPEKPAAVGPKTAAPAPKNAGAATSAAPAGERRTSAAGSGSEGGGRRSGSGGGLSGFLGTDPTPEQRQQLREIMTELGLDFRNGPPSAEQREQLKKLLVERGVITAPAVSSSDVVITTRTLYRLPGGDKRARPEPISIKAGITDGLSTEIISGLNEGDVIITSIALPGASNAAPAAQPSRSGSSNPFSGSRRF